eukprot:5305606-Pleurochrysis_carterae.AAC.1
MMPFASAHEKRSGASGGAPHAWNLKKSRHGGDNVRRQRRGTYLPEGGVTSDAHASWRGDEGSDAAKLSLHKADAAPIKRPRWGTALWQAVVSRGAGAEQGDFAGPEQSTRHRLSIQLVTSLVVCKPWLRPWFDATTATTV